MTATTQERGVGRQLAALFRMELVLLRRNMANAVLVLVLVLPLVLGLARLGSDRVRRGRRDRRVRADGERARDDRGDFMHHHLVTVYASRRQELVLKRLRAGLPSDGTIIAGAASASAAVFLAQAVVLTAYAAVVLRLPLPDNPLLVLLTLLLTAAMMTTTSAVVSGITRSSEAAMMTTFPTVALFLATPGVLVSYGTFPESVEKAAWFLPLGPFGGLVRIGWVGANGDAGVLSSLADAVPEVAVISAWLVLTALAVKRSFRWEPRHS